MMLVSHVSLSHTVRDPRKERGPGEPCGERKGSEVRLYLELVIGAVYLLVVINFKRIQELEVHSEAPLHPDAIVAA